MKAFTNKKQAVVASVLDKLIDEDPDKKQEMPMSRHQKLTELCASVRRDLENLLNARQTGLVWPAAWKDLDASLLTYGISDFMSNPPTTATAQKQFCEQLAKIIQHFETRFKNIRVVLLQNTEKQDRTLRLRIEGLLYAEPAPEPIIFDSILEPETNSFSILKIND